MLAARADRKAGPDASSGLRQVATGRLSMPAKDEGREGVRHWKRVLCYGRLVVHVGSGSAACYSPFSLAAMSNNMALTTLRPSIESLMITRKRLCGSGCRSIN